MEKEKFIHSLSQLMGKGSSFQIMEDQVDFQLQKAYFDMARSYRDGEFEVNGLPENLLFDPLMGEEEKRQVFIDLAHRGDVESYRLIERFIEEGAGEMRDWAVLARNECRMHLESSLLEEDQVYISTGMGGKAGMLRFFIVLLTSDGAAFDDFRQRTTQKELEYQLAQKGGELEWAHFDEELGLFRMLIPISLWPRDFLEGLISEINTLGNFLNSDYMITNVRELEVAEIRDFLSGKSELKLLPPGFSAGDEDMEDWIREE